MLILLQFMTTARNSKPKAFTSTTNEARRGGVSSSLLFDLSP
jgi:hypothetical protein